MRKTSILECNDTTRHNGVIIRAIGIRFWLFILSIILFVFGSSACTSKVNRDHRVLILGHGLDVEHPVHLAMIEMAKRAKEYSGGRLEIRVYPSEQLGPERDMLEQLQLGLVDMTKVSTSPLESFVPKEAVFSLPYVFRNPNHYWTVLEGPIGEELLNAGEARGLKGLSYYDSGSRSFYTQKPIMTPADLQGLKIRVQQSRTSMDMVTALGGSPTPISFGELYTALQQGVVDGAENNLPSFYLSRHYEVCRHYSMDEHTRTPDMLLVSTETWESLDAELQEALMRAARESSVIQRKLWKQKEEESLAAILEAGVEVHTPDPGTFRAAVDEMLKSYEGTEVGELVERIAAVEDSK